MLKSFNSKIDFLPNSRLARGFTLLELLLVVALLALLASVALVAMDRTGTEARNDLARIEMNEIRKALRMFYRDVGHFPDALSGVVAEDLRASLLLSCDEASDVGCTTWDPDAKRGWNGPYLSSEGVLDPWERNYRLEEPETADARLESDGPDGITGTGDDVVIYLSQ